MTAFAAVEPPDLVALLMSLRWRRGQEVRGGHVWTSPGDEADLVVPETNRYRDYALRVGDLVHAVATLGQRELDDVLRDLLDARRDRVDLRFVGKAWQDEAPLAAGAEAPGRLRDLMNQAAAVVHQGPRPVLSGRRPDRVRDYLSSLALLPARPGSFVVGVAATVPPPLGQDVLDGQEDEPFERAVTQQLLRATSTAVDAARDVMYARAAGDVFADAIADGVSSDLLQTLAELAEPTESVYVEVGYALTRPLQPAAPVEVPQYLTGALREGARHLRAREPRDVVIRGDVVRLNRAADADAGDVQVHADVGDDGQLRKILVPLSKQDYKSAVEAHRDQQQVRVTGRLVEAAGRWRLEDPSAVSVVPPPEGR